jgi:hypothetical protein
MADSPHVLDGALIVTTIVRLQARIAERFPESGLSRVCADLVTVGLRTVTLSAELGRPFFGIRVLVGLILAGAVGLLGWTFRLLHPEDLARANLVEIAQGTDAALNMCILAAAGAWFCVTLERRLKRGRVHAALSELRALAHVIDMHQLTKDPTILLSGMPPSEAARPRRAMSEFELSRYLDYCAEMLALIAKLAALYQVAHTDPEIGAEVAGIEGLTSDLGRKIWQKITIIGQLSERRGSKRRVPPTA